MKKLTILLAVILISTTSFAQSEKINVLYWRLGYSIPSWNQFGFPDEISEVFSKSGGMFELGKIYMVNSIPLPENMAIGINADFFSIYYHGFSSDYDDDVLGTFRLDSKIGPSFTYNPINNLAIDAYVKADIGWVTATADIYDSDASNADVYLNFGTIGLSTGFNVRYSKLMLGFEFNTISPKLKSVDDDTDYIGNITDGGNKSPLPSITISIGMAFGKPKK